MAVLTHLMAEGLVLTLVAVVGVGVIRDRRAARRISDLETRVTAAIRAGSESASYAVGYVDGIRDGGESAKH